MWAFNNPEGWAKPQGVDQNVHTDDGGGLWCRMSLWVYVVILCCYGNLVGLDSVDAQGAFCT